MNRIDPILDMITHSYPQVRRDRIALFTEMNNSNVEPPKVLFIEFHGNRVDDVRNLQQEIQLLVDRSGYNCRIEFVCDGWLPIDSNGNVALFELEARYQRALKAKENKEILDGSFSTLPDEKKDCFRYFGNESKIRTPCEITYPSYITVGNWVSLGRYGKIIMLPEESYDYRYLKNLSQMHYPDIANSFDYESCAISRPADLYFGDGTTLGDRYFIICTKSIKFGHHVMAASDLFVSDCHHTFEQVLLPPVLLPVSEGKDVIIGDHTWIGIRCSILEGVRIGRHSVIAAHSVVKSDVEPYTLVAGVPATKKKTFNPPHYEINENSIRD